MLLVALSCVPSLAQAEGVLSPQASAGAALGKGVTQAVPLDISPGSPSDYAAREATAPQLGEFAGGGGGVYIGTGALVVGLIVLIVILLVR